MTGAMRPVVQHVAVAGERRAALKVVHARKIGVGRDADLLEQPRAEQPVRHVGSQQHGGVEHRTGAEDDQIGADRFLPTVSFDDEAGRPIVGDVDGLHSGSEMQGHARIVVEL